MKITKINFKSFARKGHWAKKQFGGNSGPCKGKRFLLGGPKIHWKLDDNKEPKIRSKDLGGCHWLVIIIIKEYKTYYNIIY